MGRLYPGEEEARPTWEWNLRCSVGRARADMGDLFWYIIYGYSKGEPWREDRLYKGLATEVYEDLYFMALDRMLLIDERLIALGWPPTNRYWVEDHVAKVRGYGERVPTRILKWWNEHYDEVMATAIENH